MKKIIPGFSKYDFDIVTHEICNVKTKRLMKPHFDSRNRLRLNLINDNGDRRTVVIKDLAKRLMNEITTVVTVEFKLTTCYVYHIKRSGMGLEDGYIGVTNNPKRRWYSHKKENTDVTPYLSKFTDIDMELIFEGDRKDCLDFENKLRPEDGMGWNTTRGGDLSHRLRGNDGKIHTPDTLD